MTHGDAIDARLTERFRLLRRRVGRLVPSNYDIVDRCNLRCEGCLFYEGEDHKRYKDAAVDADWESFVGAEVRRGVNFAYVAGGEPSLVPDRLRLLASRIPFGVIFTNGTRQVPREIGYRIHVSVWGDQHQTRMLRAADTTTKAVELYAGDSRALFTYTINALNIGGIYPTARQLNETGVGMTFSYFSPTLTYQRKIADAVGNDDAFFRLSSAERNLRMTPEFFERARNEIVRAMEDFPGTILYSLAYDDWLTAPQGVYDIDPTSMIARDCGNRRTPQHRHYNVDLSRSQQKCCSPNIDCRECRAYAQSYATYLHRVPSRRDPVRFARWLDVWELWADMFMPLVPVDPVACEAAPRVMATL